MQRLIKLRSIWYLLFAGLTAYRYAIYIVSVKSPAGFGIPVAAFVLSQETTETLTTCLQALRKHSKMAPRFAVYLSV